MSFRYASGIVKPGFNSLAAPTLTGYAYNLYGWGANSNGQLGLGNTTSYSSPKQVGSLTGWSQVQATTVDSSFALKTDGTMWSWGNNNNGQLGLGNRTNYSSPKQIGALTSWYLLSTSFQGFMAAIKTDGTLWTWGVNTYGQLGLGNTTSYSSPKQVGSLTTWAKVAQGAGHTMAIKTDGTLWAWGRNQATIPSGQLGLGNSTNYSSPMQVGALSNWLNVACGFYHTLATKTDGTFWSWGATHGSGGLGLGNNNAYSSPKQVGILTDWSSPSAGYYNSFAIKTNGTIWSWGEGYMGSLGHNNRTYYSSPKQVGALTTWSMIDAGARQTAAISTNGSLWMWGINSSGQLGSGNQTNYSSPKQVGSLTNWLTVSAGYHTLAAG